MYLQQRFQLFLHYVSGLLYSLGQHRPETVCRIGAHFTYFPINNDDSAIAIPVTTPFTRRVTPLHVNGRVGKRGGETVVWTKKCVFEREREREGDAKDEGVRVLEIGEMPL